MRRPATIEIGPLGLITLALGGTWLGHNVEYARVRGPRHFAGASVRSTHAYMGPTGLVLLLVATLGVAGTIWTAARLRRQLARVRAGATVDVPKPRPTLTFDVATLTGFVWVWQLVLWVLEENIELHLTGAPAPGLRVLVGVHALAPVVHLAIAAALAIAVWMLRRPVAELARALHEAQRQRIRVLVRTACPPVPVTRSWTPVERWGRHLWSRPPPAPAATC